MVFAIIFITIPHFIIAPYAMIEIQSCTQVAQRPVLLPPKTTQCFSAAQTQLHELTV